MFSRAFFFSSIIFLFSLVVFLPGIGSPSGLRHYMERAYSVPIPLEMKEQGEYLTPLLEGEPHLLKPPLLWWLIILSYKIFGASLASLRLPSALFTAGTVAATIPLALTLGLETEGALAASLLALGSFGLSGSGRLALIDAPLTFFMVIAFWGLCRSILHHEKSGLYICGIASGCSMMCKWPVAPAVIGLLMVGWLLWEQTTEPGPHLWGAALAALAIALPWNAVMAWRYDLDYWRTVFLGELFSVRFLTSENVPVSVFLAQFLAALAPWTLILMATTFRRGKHRTLAREDKLILLWVAASLLPFLIQKTKTERYVLYCIPALTIWIVRHWDGSFPIHRWAARLTSGMLIVFTGGLLGLGIWFKVGALSCLLMVVSIAFAVWGLSRSRQLAWAGLGSAGALMTTLGFLLPSLNTGRFPPPQVFANAPRGIGILCQSHEMSYLPVHIDRPIWTLQDLSRLRLALSQGRAIIACEDDLPRLKAFLRVMGGGDFKNTAEWSYPQFKLSDHDQLRLAFQRRSLRLLGKPRYLLSDFSSPEGFSPRGTFVPGPLPQITIQPGAYVATLAVDCPKGMENIGGFHEIAWIHLRDHNRRINLSNALFKRDLLRSKPYIFVWPFLSRTSETLRAFIEENPGNPRLQIQGLWLQTADPQAIRELDET